MGGLDLNSEGTILGKRQRSTNIFLKKTNPRGKRAGEIASGKLLSTGCHVYKQNISTRVLGVKFGKGIGGWRNLHQIKKKENKHRADTSGTHQTKGR